MIELLVAIAVIGVIAAASLGTLSSSLDKAGQAREVAAGKTLIAAYQAYATENNGRYLPSFDPSAQDVTNDKGAKITMKAVSERYTFRLAPYFDYKLRGTVLVNKNEKQISSKMGSGSMFDYGVSAFPAFGINRYLVGGIVSQDGSVSYPNECITRQSQGDINVIAFALAGSTEIDGFEYVKPPTLNGGWSKGKWKRGVDPGNYGGVRARDNGKSVAVYLDGSVKLQSLEELSDMRLWSRNAALENNPEYVLDASL